jgi:hypothetical protein
MLGHEDLDDLEACIRNPNLEWSQDDKRRLIAQARLAIHFNELLSSHDQSIDLPNGLRVCSVGKTDWDDLEWIVTDGRGIEGEFETAEAALEFAEKGLVRDDNQRH